MTRLHAIAGDIRAVHALGTQRALRRLARAAITEPEFQAEIRRLRRRAYMLMSNTVASVCAARIIARQRRVLRAVALVV